MTQDSANLISIIADIREKSGVGAKPMLGELADAIALALSAAYERGQVEQWQPIETAPKDGTPIIGWCVHEADAYHNEATGKLTDYGCWAEALSRVPDGPAVLEWGGEDSDYDEWSDRMLSWPNWWFRVGSDFEEVGNPIFWQPITPPAIRSLPIDSAGKDDINAPS